MFFMPYHLKWTCWWGIRYIGCGNRMTQEHPLELLFLHYMFRLSGKVVYFAAVVDQLLSSCLESGSLYLHRCRAVVLIRKI